jgi:DNA end-binding protein Ku
MWKGSLGFGMVIIPVKMYKAVENKSIHFNQIHEACGARVQMPKYCPNCEKQLDASEIVKAYPLDEKAGQYIPVTKEELENLPLSSAKNIQVEAFVKAIDDVRWFDTSYVLSPEEVGVRGFVLFVKAMEELNLIGVAKIAVREKETLCALRPQDGILILQTMHWGDELRDYGELIPFADVNEKEMEMAKNLLGTMTKEIDLHDFKDDYRQALVDLITAKLEGTELPAPAKEKKQEGDLVDMLEASLKATGTVA